MALSLFRLLYLEISIVDLILIECKKISFLSKDSNWAKIGLVLNSAGGECIAGSDY